MPGHSISDLWRTKWHCDRFLWQYVGFYPIVIILPVLFTHLHPNTAVSEGQAGEVTSSYSTGLRLLGSIRQRLQWDQN
jgi:hypothetical protein